MTIAIDAGDVEAIRKHLRVASEDLGEAVPQLPGAAAFGPQVLGSAVASFESAVRRQTEQLTERWAALDNGVRETFDDMSAVEDELVAGIGRLCGAFAPTVDAGPLA
ncbi:hypothetical protein PQI23_05395 [Leucobacter sp. USCH14]|uniref:hypothetical protein n=1 Tax=Leucobacter sp. USCH14 TaxID=3024838 RepID=UPI0030B33D97